jgi:PAS domain S-box-containing protein
MTGAYVIFVGLSAVIDRRYSCLICMKESADLRKRRRPLRQRAEQLMVASPSEIMAMPDQKVRALVYELQIHQIELELQNEELLQTQLELAATRDRYSDLYEFAPIGYVTVDKKGRVIEANLAAAGMLGADRKNLIGREIYRFVARESRDDCYLHFRNAFDTKATEICELKLPRSDGRPLIVSLHSLAQAHATETPVCRTALINVTEARVAQRNIEKLRDELEHRVTARTADLQRKNEELAEQSEKLEQYKTYLQTMSSELLIVEERQRQQLAEDLHDTFGQVLFQARMKLDRPPLNDQTISELRTILDETKKKVNALTYELSPLAFREMGLRTALKWLIENLKQRYGLRVRMTGDASDSPIEGRVGTVLFWSVREILINVAKHAETDFASLSVRHFDHDVEVSIRDLGKGFNLDDQPGHVRNGHFGLFSVRERLEYVGGSINIRSVAGKGTTVNLKVPVSRRSHT